MRDTLGELGGFIASDYLMIGGDWNTDFGRTCDFTDVVSLFIVDRTVVIADLNFKDQVGSFFS